MHHTPATGVDAFPGVFRHQLAGLLFGAAAGPDMNEKEGILVTLGRVPAVGAKNIGLEVAFGLDHKSGLGIEAAQKLAGHGLHGIVIDDNSQVPVGPGCHENAFFLVEAATAGQHYCQQGHCLNRSDQHRFSP